MNKRQTKKFQSNMKIKDEILKVRKEASEALQFLVDIGSKKHRAKYKGSNKDLTENKKQIIDYFIKEITAVVLLRHMCKGKARCKPGLRKSIFDDADKLMEELFNNKAGVN